MDNQKVVLNVQSETGKLEAVLLHYPGEDQTGLGFHQFLHLIIGQLHITDADLPVIFHQLIQTDDGIGGGIRRIARCAGLHLGARFIGTPRLGQHDRDPGLFELCDVMTDEVDDLQGIEANIPIPRLAGAPDGAVRCGCTTADPEAEY